MSSENGKQTMLTVKSVGKSRAMTLRAALDWNAATVSMAPQWSRRRPRGVYRFKTWEDLERWETNLTNALQHQPK